MVIKDDELKQKPGDVRVSASYLPDASLLYLINSFPLLPMLPIGKISLFFQAFVQGQTVACNHMKREGADAIP